MNLTIKGYFFDGHNSSKHEAVLICTEIGQLSFEGLTTQNYQQSEVEISPRVGNTIRYLDFPGGSQFETADNDAVDSLVTKFRPSKLHNIVFRLEKAKKVVVAALVILLIGGGMFIQYGIPYLSREIAMALPEETSDYLGQGMLDTLDDNWFESTELSVEKQGELNKLFLELKNNLGNVGARLEYRNSKIIGANAFALPNGIVVITDQLVEIAFENEEIVAILLHELGHVQNRHILRKMIQSFGMSFFIMAISGDVSTASTIIASAPLLFIQAGYSQNMEIEADSISLEYLQAHNIEPIHFVTIMRKLEASHSFEYKNCMRNTDKDIQSCLSSAIEHLKESKSEGRSFGSYLSTHPPTDDRILRFKESGTTKP